MTLNLDFTGVEPAKIYDVIPPGKYLIAVKAAEEVTAGTGTPGIKLTLEVLGGEYAGGEIRDGLYFSPKAMPFVMQRLQALGVQIPAGPFQLTASQLVGKRAVVTCRDEEYEGTNGPAKTLRVKSYDPAGSAQEQPTATAAGTVRDSDIPF